MATIFVGSATCGSRPATKVLVRSTLVLANGHVVARHSRYSGERGTVVRTYESGTVMVRLANGCVLPFAMGELQVVA